jgi:hypothetical protein
MAGFYGQNPVSTVVGSTSSAESTIAENLAAQTDTSGGFYQGSPTQTTTDAYTADALSSKNDAAVSASAAAQSATLAAASAASSSVVLTGSGSTTVTGVTPNFTISTPTVVSAFTNDENYLGTNSTLDAGNF